MSSSSTGARAQRALGALPFLLLAIWCFRTMDLEKLVALQQPFADAGVIEWELDGGDRKSVAILDRFHRVDFLDRAWRGSMATFSVSTFGYDGVAAWQTFEFLVDLGPVYAIWVLESGRAASAGTPAYLPTFFAVAGQFLGLGPVAPVFYFLCIAFGPTATDLARSSTQRQTVWHGSSVPLLPIVLLFHTFEVLAMFLAPKYTTRHFWTWAWQLTPLWIGVANVVAGQALRLLRSKNLTTGTPKPLLVVLGLVSSSVWVYTLLFCPYSLSTLFVPQAGPQSEFVPHIRKALQVDELGVFGSSLLWLAYSYVDMYTAGLVGSDWLFYAASLPIVTLCAGPGTAFILGWCVRERILMSALKG